MPLKEDICAYWLLLKVLMSHNLSPITATLVQPLGMVDVLTVALSKSSANDPRGDAVLKA